MTTFLRSLWLFARRKPLGAMGGVVLLATLFAAIFANAILPYDPLAHDIPNRLASPGLDYYFGTDSFGRDQFRSVVHGSRVSLYVGGVSVTVGTVMGILFGIVSAYWGGRIDLAVQRAVDVLLGIPFLVLAVVVIVALGTFVHTVVIAITAAFIPQMTRLARSSALSVKAETYVLAAEAMGASPARVVMRHILPNSLAPVIAYATGYFGAALVAESALSFLGLGVPPPEPSWGRMLQEGARHYLEAAPWLAVFPGLALTIVVLSFALLGDALRDVLDPRLTVLRAGRAEVE